MAKKNKKGAPVDETSQQEKDAGSYYKIKKDAVDRLVNASGSTAPEVTDDEIAKVSGKKKFRIPNIVKVLFIKWWFNGAICFFFFFGFGTILAYGDLIIVLGAALGILTDLLTNNILKFIEPEPRYNDKYMFITVRKFWSVFLNLVYGFVCLNIVMYLYELLNLVVLSIMQNSEPVSTPIQVEPIAFGILYLLVDLLFILIKNTFKKIIDDAKAKSRR